MAYYKIKLGLDEGEKSTFTFSEDIYETCLETLKAIFDIEILSAETTLLDGKYHVTFLIENEQKKQLLMDSAIKLFRKQCPQPSVN